MYYRLVLISCLWLTLPGIVVAQVVVQSQSTDTTRITPLDQDSLAQVKVIERTIAAVNYPNHGGSTKIDFRGSDLMPQASGDAKVESKTGRTSIEARFEHLRRARDYGPEFLTYVLWAITPHGRAANLGEVIPDHDGKSSLRTATEFQSFGMIVTAEPYFAVTRPSNMVILENVLRYDTKGAEVPIEAQFEALDRGDYVVSLPAWQLPAATADRRVPLELLEARNAVAIARASGAEQYAPAAYQNAVSSLERAEHEWHRKRGSNDITTAARAATQSAEDARLLAIQQRHQAQATAEREAARQRTEEARQQEVQAQQEASQARQQAAQAQQEASLQQAQAELQRQQAEHATREADEERAAAEQAKQRALQQQQALAADAEQAQQQALNAEQRAVQAEQEKEQMRQRLLTQLNQVLQTRDTARGLIVDMNDVLFDTGKTTLKPDAKVRLAKVAGIIEAYPDLHLQIEGYTDSTGSPEVNQVLSERRATTVRDFLIAQGVPVNNVVARGFGADNPIASNTTPQGRQINRRVDLVVSGQTIESAAGANASGVSGSSTAQE